MQWFLRVQTQSTNTSSTLAYCRSEWPVLSNESSLIKCVFVWVREPFQSQINLKAPLPDHRAEEWTSYWREKGSLRAKACKWANIQKYKGRQSVSYESLTAKRKERVGNKQGCTCKNPDVKRKEAGRGTDERGQSQPPVLTVDCDSFASSVVPLPSPPTLTAHVNRCRASCRCFTHHLSLQPCSARSRLVW